MNLITLLQNLKGVQTLESIIDILNVDRKMAIYYIHRLRKKGYVKTKRLSNNKRVYNISIENKLKGKSYYEIINEYSPVKISTPSTYSIYGRKVTLEETLIFAIKTRSVRTILASLGLFRRIADWTELHRLAKENNLERKVGALYDLARNIIKTRRMSKKFRNSILPDKQSKYKYIINGLKSKDFKDIEKVWKIHIPFNKKDLEAYK